MTTLRTERHNGALENIDMETGENKYYRPPRRQEEDREYPPNIYAKFVPNLPPGSEFVSRFNENGAPQEISFGQVRGILRRWQGVTTARGDSTNVAEIEIAMPDSEFHRKVVTVFGWSAMLSDCLDYVDQNADGRVFTLRRISDEGKAHIYEVAIDAPAPNPQTGTRSSGNGSKPTTASGWSELYRSRFDNFPAGEKRNAQLQKIVATAAEDGFSFIEDELRFVSVTADSIDEEPDDLPF